MDLISPEAAVWLAFDPVCQPVFRVGVVVAQVDVMTAPQVPEAYSNANLSCQFHECYGIAGSERFELLHFFGRESADRVDRSSTWPLKNSPYPPDPVDWSPLGGW
jgi:hypothetical protein